MSGSKSNKRRIHSLALAVAAASSVFATKSAKATSDIWTGGSDNSWANSLNWLLNSGAPGAGETATFSMSAAAVNNNTTLDLGAGITTGAIVFDTAAAAAYTIGAGGAGIQTLTLDTLGIAVTVNSSVVNNQLFNAKLALSNATTPGVYVLTNDSTTATVTYAGGFTASTAGIKVININGAGASEISGAISGGSLNLLKTGAGTLTLSGGGSFSGNGALGNVPANTLFPVVLREGTTRISAGSYTVNGDMVLGGVVTDGGEGFNNRLQMDAGTLTISGTSTLSVGRGNGIGNVSSDIVLNNNSALIAANLSAGSNGGNAGNLPKGSITLNNTSSLTISGNGVFLLGEASGSNMTMTLNGSSRLVSAGTGAKRIGAGGNGTLIINGTSSVTFGNALAYVGFRQNAGYVEQNGGTFTAAGEVRIGGSDQNGIANNGTGTFVMNAGVASFGAMTIARGNNNQNTNAGTVILNGGTLTSESDAVLGFAGNNNLGYMKINGGAFNVASTIERWMILPYFDTSRGQVDMNSGTLNLNTNTDMRFLRGNNGTSGSGTFNHNGGMVTFYSDNQTTIGGTGGVIDMALAGSATAVSEYNLNGGTLTVGQVISGTALSTRRFNFNGGVIRPTGSIANWINIGAGSSSLNVQAGGAKIDTRGFNVGITQALLGTGGDGGLSKAGDGELNLTANNTYNGPTQLTGGRLLISGAGAINSSSGITVNSSTARFVQTSSVAVAPTLTLTSGTVDGTGVINTVNVASNAANTITHGNGGTGSITIGALAFSGAGNFSLNVTNTSPVVAVTGTLSTNGSGNVLVNASNTLWNQGTYNLISYGTLGGSGFGAFQKGTIGGLSNRQTATLTNPAGFIALTIGGDNPRWTGALSNEWSTAVLGNPKNWQLISSGTPTDYIDGDIVLFDDAATTTTPTISVANVSPTSVLFDNTSKSYTLGGAFGVAGSATVTKSGTGAVTIATSNTYTGGTTLNAGTLNVNNASAIGSGTLTITGGALDNTTAGPITLAGNNPQVWNGNFTYGGTQPLNMGTGSVSFSANRTVTVNGTGPLTVGGAIGGANQLTKAGTGTLILTGNNTYTGSTVITGGALEVAGGTTGVIGSDIQIAPNTTDSGSLVVSGGTVNAFRVIIAGASTNNTTPGTGVVTQTGGTINSQAWFTVGSGGTTSGAGTYNLSGGTLNVFTQQIEVANFTGSTGAVNMTGGAINIGNSNFISLGANNGALNGTFTQSGGAVTFYSNATLTTVGGNGILSLGRAGTTSGTYVYNLNGGTLTVPQITRTAGNTATAILNLNGGVLKAATGSVNLINTLTTANVKAGGAIIDTNGLNVSIPQALVHDAALVPPDGGLTKRGAGQLALLGNNTYNGPTNVEAGTLAVTTTSQLGGGAINVSDSAALTMTSGSATSSLVASSVTVGNTTGGILNFNLGAFTPAAPIINASGPLTRNGTNTVNVTGAALQNGTITLIQYTGTEGGTGSFTLGPLPNRVTGQLYDLGTGKLDLSIVSDTPRWTGAGDDIWTTAVQSPKNWITLSTAAATDYIEGDSVLFNDLASESTVAIPANVSPTGVTVANSTLDYTFTGAGGIVGTGALIKTGDNTLFINNTGTNSYSGGSSIAAGGTIEIGGTDVFAGDHFPLGTGPITNNGVIHVNRSQVGNPQFGGVFLNQNISGSGSIIASENTILSGNNTFDGTVTVKSGATAFLDSATALGSTVGGTVVEDGGRIAVFVGAPNFGNEAITISGNGPTYTDAGATNGAIFVSNNNVTMGGTLTLAASAAINVGGSTLTLNGQLDGAGKDLTKVGGGRLVLGNSASYATTIINGGQLRIGNGGTLGNLGTGNVQLGGVLEFNRSDTYTVDHFITGTGSVLNVGAGTAILTNLGSDFFGAVGASAGTLVLQGAGFPTTFAVSGNGVLKVTNENYSLFASNVTISSNNAQTGALELSNGISNPFNGTTVNFAGRNNATTGIRSTNGTNTLPGNILLNAGGGEYRIEATPGGTFNVTANVSGNTGVGGARNVTYAGAGVGTMSGVISLGGAATLGVAKTGSGTWTLSGANSYNGVTTVNGGTLVLAPAAETPVTSAGANITNGYLVLDNAGGIASTVPGVLDAGFDQSPKFSAGTLRSSTADATKGLGWKVAGSTTIVGYAYYGDANLDGTVNTLDFDALAVNFNKATGGIWVEGDFNYDGKVNALDFNGIATSYGLTITAPAAPLPSATALGAVALGALVPEPASMATIVLSAATVLGRRRRRA